MLASLSGLLYSSWPLGYVLNPVANRGLASNLEALHQPYSWLFVALDILCGLLVSYLAWHLYGLVQKQQTFVRVAIISYGLFGLTTALDAILPLDCAADQHQCGLLLNHPLVILHGIISIASIGLLTLSLVLLWRTVRAADTQLRWLPLILVGFNVIWFFFGIVTGILLLLDRSSAFSQHVFISACSLWMVALPYVLVQEINRKSLDQKVRVAKTPQRA